MSDDTLRFLLQIIGVFVGGSAVQMLIFLIRRRAEVRNLDVQSDVGLLGAAQAQIAGLTGTEASLRRVIDEKDAKIGALERRIDDEESEHTRALEESERTVSRLSADVARLRAELSTVRYQLDLVTREQPRHGRGGDDP